MIIGLSALGYRAAQELDWAPKDVALFPLLILGLWVLCLFWLFTSGSIVNLHWRLFPGRRGLVIAILFGAVVGAASGAAWWKVYVMHAEKMAQLTAKAVDESRQQGPQKAPMRNPDIEVSYEMRAFGLPLPLEPFSVTPLIAIRGNRKAEMVGLANNQDKKKLWPTDERIIPPEWLGKIVISSHDGVPLFNLSYAVDLVVGSKSDSEGEVRTKIELPLIDLAPGDSKAFYIVNQSATAAMVNFSAVAVVKVQGENERRQVSVRLRNITFFDKIPILVPSFHKWSGDKILDPDQEKLNKQKAKQKKPSPP